MSVTSKSKLLAKLRNKDYRDAYVEEKVTTSLPFQIRALREERDWSQVELGNRAEMRQNAVSRLEDAESGPPSINTLLRLARAFDVALLVKFVPFTKLLNEFSDLSFEALRVPAFDREAPALAIDAMSDQVFAALQPNPQSTNVVVMRDFLKTRRTTNESNLAKAASGM